MRELLAGERLTQPANATDSRRGQVPVQQTPDHRDLSSQETHAMLNRKWNNVIAAFAVVVMAACGGDSEPDTTDTGAAPAAPAAPAQPVGTNVELPEGITLDMVQAGKTVFETTTCFTCHGMNAAGTALAPSLLDQDWLNSDGSFDDIMNVVRNGVLQPVQYPAAMPAMGGAQLTEDQIRDVTAYVYAISHGG
jgi:mono/diheme cytochrome c family protein